MTEINNHLIFVCIIQFYQEDFVKLIDKVNPIIYHKIESSILYSLVKNKTYGLNNL